MMPQKISHHTFATGVAGVAGVVTSEAIRCHVSRVSKAANASKASKAVNAPHGPKVIHMPKPHMSVLHLNYIKPSIPKRLEIW